MGKLMVCNEQVVSYIALKAGSCLTLLLSLLLTLEDILTLAFCSSIYIQHPKRKYSFISLMILGDANQTYIMNDRSIIKSVLAPCARLTGMQRNGRIPYPVQLYLIEQTRMKMMRYINTKWYIFCLRCCQSSPCSPRFIENQLLSFCSASVGPHELCVVPSLCQTKRGVGQIFILEKKWMTQHISSTYSVTSRRGTFFEFSVVYWYVQGGIGHPEPRENFLLFPRSCIMKLTETFDKHTCAQVGFPQQQDWPEDFPGDRNF